MWEACGLVLGAGSAGSFWLNGVVRGTLSPRLWRLDGGRTRSSWGSALQVRGWRVVCAPTAVLQARRGPAGRSCASLP